MSGKKSIIIAVGVLVAILAIGFVLFSGKKQPQQQAQNTGGQNVTTGTGSFVQVAPGPTYDLRGNLVVKTDPTQPFASVAPRAAEPAQNNQLAQTPTGSSLQFQNYSQAVNNGLIRDQNGMYHQVVNTSGFSPAELQTYNYALPDDQFLQTYYPQANDLLNSGNPASASNLTQGADSLAILPNNPNQTVDVVPGVDPTLFKIISADDHTSLMNYINQLSNITSAFDIYNDQNTINNALSSSNTDTLNSYGAEAKAVQDKIVALAVPQGLLGLAQAYYQAYQDYQNFINFEIASIEASGIGSGSAGLSGSTTGSASAGTAQIDPNSYDTLQSALSDLNIRVKEAVTYVNNRQ